MTPPSPRPDRSQLTTGLVVVALVGILLLVVAVLYGDPWKIVGAVVFLAAEAPLVMAARAQPLGVGREQLRPQMRVLWWFLATVALCALGLVLYSR